MKTTIEVRTTSIGASNPKPLCAGLKVRDLVEKGPRLALDTPGSADRRPSVADLAGTRTA